MFTCTFSYFFSSEQQQADAKHGAEGLGRDGQKPIPQRHDAGASVNTAFSPSTGMVFVTTATYLPFFLVSSFLGPSSIIRTARSYSTRRTALYSLHLLSSLCPLSCHPSLYLPCFCACLLLVARLQPPYGLHCHYERRGDHLSLQQ